ncbi:MAG: hypothetical protein ACRC6V_03150 [Bacteroidales bacterium]
MNEKAIKLVLKNRAGFNEYCRIINVTADVTNAGLLNRFFKFYTKYVCSVPNRSAETIKKHNAARSQDIMNRHGRLHGSYGSRQ